MLYTVSSDATQPVQLVFAARRRGNPTYVQTITNRDPLNTLLIASADADHQIPDFTAGVVVSIVDPLQSYVVDGTADIWGVAQAVPGSPASQQPGNFTITVDVVDTSVGTSGSPLAIATAIAISSLPLVIAEQIAASGISLIAAPKLLYGGQVPRTGAGLVGVSLIDYKGFQVNLAHNQVALAINAWNTDMGRKMGGNVMKRYNHEGVLPATNATDSENAFNLGAAGVKCLISMKPFRDTRNPPTYAGAIPGQGGLTFAQEFTNLVNSVAYFVSVCTAGVEFTLWQEPNLDPTIWDSNPGSPNAGANYAAYMNFYGPAFKPPQQAASQILTYDPVTSQTAGNITAFWNGGSYASLINKIVCDAYCLDYTKPTANNGQRFVDALNYLTGLADSLGLPFGFWEWGVTDGTATVPITPAEAIAAGKPAKLCFQTWNETYILGTLVARLNALKTNADCVWYVQGTSQNDPAADPDGGTCGVGIDTAVSCEIDAVFDGVTSAPSSIVSIAAGATITLPPNDPSPGGGYAVADGLSYDITINLTTGAGSTVPFAAITLQWVNSDIVNAQPVDTQTWVLPCGTAGTSGTIIVGKGPQRGQFLAVTIHNQDSVVITANVQLNSTSRTQVRDAWTWDVNSSVAVPNYSLATGGASHVNEVGVVSALSIPASGSVTKLFGLFSGQAFLRISGESSGFLQYVFTPQPPGIFGGAALVNEIPTAEFEEMILLPRGPVQCVISNSDAAAAHNANIIITSLD